MNELKMQNQTYIQTNNSSNVEKIYITNCIYQQLIMMPNVPPETGGILGGNNNIISKYVCDFGIKTNNCDTYSPNINVLNSCIEQWRKNLVDFYGIVHTHRKHAVELSFGDIVYINKIMHVIKNIKKELLFPIVIPNEEIIWYKAYFKFNDVKIEKIDVKNIDC